MADNPFDGVMRFDVVRDGEETRTDLAGATALREVVETAARRGKASYVGAPAIFSLELACRQINEAFGEGYGCYLVGSSTQRADWRDVDVSFIMDDAAFALLFPDAGKHWEHDARWLLLTVAISGWLSKLTGLPVDFKIQPQTHANERHKGPRHALGLRMAKPQPGA